MYSDPYVSVMPPAACSPTQRGLCIGFGPWQRGFEMERDSFDSGGGGGKGGPREGTLHLVPLHDPFITLNESLYT